MFSDFLNIEDERAKELYREIIEAEWKLSGRDSWDENIKNADEIANITKQIMEYATQSLVLRVYTRDYNLTGDFAAYESVSAHVNLLKYVLECALRFKYRGKKPSEIPFYNEILEAAGWHDLPENVIGDIPDNKIQSDDSKYQKEVAYWKKFSDLSPEYDRSFNQKVNQLLNEMRTEKTPQGRLLRVADKTVAVLIVLCYDFNHFMPSISKDSEKASKLNHKGMHICGRFRQRDFHASELWTVDYLILRRFDLLDDTGFFTAILIMATLLVNGGWYEWRTKSYH
ncbi:HD domain-containing protein [Candidatus Saccharibacteria bacterium]|nr:HD domain-containing protein [Candidatus Saccharibacteria bacterium]